MRKRILLSGATGFVGGWLYPALVDAGHDVVCGSRRPEQAARRFGDRTWIEIDMDRPGLVERALEGIDIVDYLVHGMAEKGAGAIAVPAAVPAAG